MNLFDHPEPFPALSLWQPWASAMALGLKRVETRPPWAKRLSALVGHDLAICSTSSTPRAAFAAAMMNDRMRDALVRRLPDYDPEAIVSASTYRAGAVLAVVRVAAVLPMVDATEPIVQHPADYIAVCSSVLVIGHHDDARSAEQRSFEHERPFGDYAPGRVGIVTEDLRPLAEPVPCSGRQQVWHLPADVAALVREQVAA